MAADRAPQSAEREACFSEAISLLRVAAQRENDLLNDVAPWEDCAPMGDPPPTSNGPPPPPGLLSRTETSIVLQPRAWRGPRDVNHVRCFGKASGAGTDVSLTNSEYVGTGCPIRYDAATGRCDSIAVCGLCPNESYVFAVAAFDAMGNVIGGIGETCAPVDALAPLPLPLCYGLVAREALRLGNHGAAAAAARALYCRLVDVDSAKGHALRTAAVSRAQGLPCLSCHSPPSFRCCEHAAVRVQR